VTTWSISEASAKTGLSQHTLRWYERIGLLDAVDRTADGRRRYSERDLDLLNVFTKLRDTGMPVKEMRRYAGLVRSGAGQAERLELLKQRGDILLLVVNGNDDAERISFHLPPMQSSRVAPVS